MKDLREVILLINGILLICDKCTIKVFKMDSTGAYGGGKAGGAFDPQAFIQRPPVIVRAVCWVSLTVCCTDNNYNLKTYHNDNCILNIAWLYRILLSDEINNNKFCNR